ncbi:hypothetical protein GH714_033367 [Hevea brasiliensis]|uniref:Glycosyltransferase N-terminal domain-containing protein n=1 Tax=Hevea brasiliensis TaxID=3981 RepID=A0A6A6NKF5_HEVBR|nr:hypothetical protein GH714_033367 [Hevea brasiliensis]
MESIAILEKPHALCIPFPSQGHINPMLKLAKLLHHNGFHITFLHTEHTHKRLLQSIGPDPLNGLPSFHFRTIPDGLPPTITRTNSGRDTPFLSQSMSKTCLAPLRTLLSEINHTSSSNVPPVTCIVSDGVMSFTLDAAQELGIPQVFFWTTSACGFMAYLHFRHLIEKGLIPFKDESYLTNGHLDTVIDWIPGMKGIRLRDIPSFIRTTDPENFMLNFLISETERAQKASAIVLNTFDALEHEVLAALFHYQNCLMYTPSARFNFSSIRKGFRTFWAVTESPAGHGVFHWQLSAYKEMDPGRYGLQQGWDNNSALEGYGGVHEPNYRVGGSYDDRRFHDERYTRDNVYQRNAFDRTF